MDYTIRVIAKCSDYGFKVIMDPHQDTVRLLPCAVLHTPLTTLSSSGLVSQAVPALPFGH
jgi:hypothetical protein